MSPPRGVDFLDWSKGGGLVPAIVQHADSGEVLMLGYMNAEALAVTRDSSQVTFYSRSRERLWTKGETSGHGLELVSIHADCDADALLVRARPRGPTCHLGTSSCFGLDAAPALATLARLDALIAQRRAERPSGHYTTRLFEAGTRRIAQKVGEEGVETALAAVAQAPEDLLGEAADLIYHLLVLLHARNLGLEDLTRTLAGRQGPAPA